MLDFGIMYTCAVFFCDCTQYCYVILDRSMNNSFDYATSVGSIKTLKDYAEIYSETIFELV